MSEPSSNEDIPQPIDEVSINTDGLSVIRGSFKTEWFGTENMNETTFLSIEGDVTNSSNKPSTSDDTTSEEGDDTTPEEGDDTIPEEGDDTTPEEGDDATPEADNDTSLEDNGDDKPEAGDDTTSKENEKENSSTDKNETNTDETLDITEKVNVNIEVSDMGETTTATQLASVMFSAARSSTTRTVYFDSFNNNDSGNGWTTTGNIYIYAIGVDSSLQPMTKSQRTRAGSSGQLWEYTVPIDCTSVIFSTKDSWTTSGTNYATQTVDVKFEDFSIDSNDLNVCFALDGGYDADDNGKKTVQYLGDLGPLSQAGKSMYFFDMTSTVDAANVVAEFWTATGNLLRVSPTENGAYIIPADVTGADSSSTPYTMVQFIEINTDTNTEKELGGFYNFFNDTSGGEEAFLYDADTKNTYFYGATEKTDSNSDTGWTLISEWGALPTSDESLGGENNKTIYFNKVDFPVKDGVKFQIGDGSLIDLNDLLATAEDKTTFSYTFPDDTEATQKTVLTFIDKDGTKYHFLWRDFNANSVTLDDNDIANVTDTYYKATTVYFDATMSKLSYEGTDGTNGAKNNGNGIPYADTENVYYYATKEDGSDSINGQMVKAAKGTWTDVYKVDLPEGYSRIRFAGYGVADEDVSANGDATAMYDIPVSLANPCFYADTSDAVIYASGSQDRSGYWAEVYTTRDAEEYKTGSDVVDIATDTFTRASDVLYVDATFYDYYTDYELNGNNRDSYAKDINGNSQRNWVTFRQFDQALSEYYKENTVAIPIYTGHFQPSYGNWGTKFADIAGTLGLYGYDNYTNFFSTNNSTIDINGYGTYYDSAAQGLVSNELSNGDLIVKSGSVPEPHFNKAFLTGNNSKNAVLGEVYENVAFPFTSVDRESNGVKYWTFNSADTTLAMRKDTSKNQYYLANTGKHGWSQNVNSSSTTSGTAGSVSNTYGFFPFNETSTSCDANTYNYGFGTKLEIKFRLTSNGMVQDSSGNDAPITFTFSGDDDVWVFIDELALDVGGSHGRVTGELNFAEKKATVSSVKSSAGSSTSGSDVESSFSMDGNNTDEHTLTMFYMERGMWESNMSISFNFPDENQLEVEKQVDVEDVNQELFAGIFDKASIFTYTIRNLATHYDGSDVTSSVENKTITFNDSFSSVYPSSGSNTFTAANWSDPYGSVAHWRAKYNDAVGAYKSSRYGVIPYANGESVDVSSANKYLQFKYYYDSAGTPALNHMYIELEDNTGNKICHYLSGRVYGNASMKSKTWSTITVDLAKFVGSEEFNFAGVKYIKFGYDYEVDIYLDDFTFKSASAVNTLTGFVTKQYDIPDYESADTGELEYPIGAVYTLATNAGDSSYNVIGDDGTFVLADGDSVLFRDQFRRGSYISLVEEANEAFQTSWTMYENGEAVTSMVDGITIDLANPVPNMVGVQNYAVDDGRTEYYTTDRDEDNEKMENAYQGTPPSDPTFVFRSYSVPDTDTGMTKLKVVYTIKGLTGSLTLRKAQAEGSQPLIGEYTFLIKFTNVAGMGLEGDTPITKEITLKAGESETITGIPVNTEFTITETATDKSYLDKVTEANNNEFTFDTETKEVSGKITTEGQTFDFTIENMLKPTINIELEKKWESTNGNEIDTDLPESIVIRLQKRAKLIDGQPNTNGAWEDVILSGMTSADIILEPAPYTNEWTYSFTNLERYVDNDTAKGEWDYRVVEVKQVVNEETGIVESSTVLEEGGVLDKFQVYYTGPDKVEAPEGTDPEDDNNYTYLVENIQTASLKIVKQDMSDKTPLQGVSFRIEKSVETANGAVWEPITVTTVVIGDDDQEVEGAGSTLTTGKDGSGIFRGLADGKYRIIEIETIDGYALLKSPIEIEITRDGYKIDSQGNYTTIADDNTITITIENIENLVLPPTGGTGPLPITVGGIALCSIASLMYIHYMRKCRKEDKAS